MSDLIKKGGDNISGFNKIQIIDLANINTIPDPIDFIIKTSIDLKVNWFNLEFTPKTLKLDDNPKTTDKGIVYNPIITFFHPKENSVSLKILMDFLEKEVVVKITDSNGNVKIVGNIDSPLNLKYKPAASSQYDGKNGYTVTLFGLALTPALYFTATTTITP